MDNNNTAELRLTDIGAVRSLMARHGVDFKKSLGQNFLISEAIPRRIAESVADEIEKAAADRPINGVLEVGPGIGPLTVELCRRCARVEAVELDRTLIPVLGETLAPYDNVNVTNADFMEVDLEAFTAEKFDSHYAVAANLPYYITTPVIMKLLESPTPPEFVTVMVQKEVARRLCALPGTAEYGAVTAAVAWFGTAKKLIDVPAGCFMPRPKVDSAVIMIKRHDKPIADLKENAPLSKVIRGAFAQRRKTLSNSMSSVFSDISRDELNSAISAAGIDPQTRGETLSVVQLAAIANELA
nr:16S rRNA (adenine(1518)-N(6)/adenine(1519)-N(6))-dimethyltransferase RsmA [Clostridia bacterium]